MLRIYLAGKYSASTIIEGLENIRKGNRMATELLLEGYAVFSPWLDHQLFLQLRDGEEIPVEKIKAHSMEWLKASHAMFVLPGWNSSRGTIEEVKVALELDIPIFFNLYELNKWRQHEKEECLCKG